MTYEEFLKLPKEKQLEILEEYAQYNFHEGELNACAYEYGRGNGGCTCSFEGYINNYELIKNRRA